MNAPRKRFLTAQQIVKILIVLKTQFLLSLSIFTRTCKAKGPAKIAHDHPLPLTLVRKGVSVLQQDRPVPNSGNKRRGSLARWSHKNNYWDMFRGMTYIKGKLG